MSIAIIAPIDTQKQLASAWFLALRDRICAEFERIEEESGSTMKFARKTWVRDGGGGGEMSTMKGRVFEKVGVNISTVHGEFSEAMRKEIPGAAENPQFWAGGISLVAHMRSPLVPAVHMNTRMIVLGNTPQGGGSIAPEARQSINRGPAPTAGQPAPCDLQEANHGGNHKSWFGGGSDLNPAIQADLDAEDFHNAFKAACDRFNPDYYPRYKKWCDEYFFIRHRDESRGVGGIFYDYLNSGDWQQDFAFTQAVGETFLHIYPILVRRNMRKKWLPEEKHTQLIKRGRYAEFNLLYDRGTRFGLMTGGNPEAILMSLPPEAVWE